MAAVARLSDEEIAAGCREFALSPVAEIEVESELHRGTLGFDLSDADFDALALAAEAFSRFPPAGIPRGARLYDEQLLAAIHLLRGALVQMDTGEGKTFALSTAALALLRSHSRVYIVTANHYLAARDALATRPFWEALGLSVGLTADHSRDNASQWEANVVYTTLEALVFDSMAEDLDGAGPLCWDAVLIDEADAILLEQCVGQYTITRSTDDPGKDWSAALRIAAALDEEDVQVEEGLSPVVRLTAAGETKVIGADGSRPSDRLLLLRDVELAYAGLHVAQRGHDYEVRAEGIVTIDSASGWQKPLVRPDWLPPLEQHLGLPRKPRRVLRHAVEGIVVLRRFRRLAGASGTIAGEALQYAMLLGLPPAVVPPRTPRREGRLPDVLVRSRERAHRWVVEEVMAQGQRRPILIATDSTEEAQQLGASIEAAAAGEQGIDVRVVTDETIASQRVFEDAGRPGAVIVSTRVSGRGVDIRLSSEARANGGAMLIALGHSPEARLDRQLLGRVGRQGDPYTARFVNHAEDGLVRLVAQKRIEAIFSRLAGDGVLETKTFRRVLGQTQRSMGRHRLYTFIAGIAQGAPRGDAHELLRTWRRALGPYADGGLSSSFLSFLADRHIEAEFPALSFASRPTLEMLETAAAGICELTGDSQQVAQGLVVEATGKPAAEGRAVLSGYLAKALGEAADANGRARRALGERSARAERAALDTRLLALSEALGALEPEAADGALSGVVAAAVAAADSTSEVAVSAAGIGRVRDEMCERLLEGGSGNGPDGLGVADSDRGDYDPAWRRQARRSSWSIASETIDLASRQIAGGLGRISFQVRQTASTHVTSTYRVRVEDLGREVNRNLAAELCVNLLAGADPAEVTELFSDVEHAVPVTTPGIAAGIPSLPPPKRDGAPREEVAVSKRTGELIAEYVGALELRPVRGLDKETLVRALKAAIAGSELVALDDPDRVAAAYSEWKGSDVRRNEVPPWRWRRLDAQVRGFLRFLNAQGLAAPLPTGLRARSRSRVRRIGRALSSPGWTLALAGLGISVVLAGLLALASPVGAGFGGGVAPRLLDSLLSGGALGAGSALGPVLLALVGAMWSRFLMGMSTSSQAGVLAAERGAASLLLASGGLLVLQPWTGGSVWSVLGLLIAWIGLTGVGFLIRNSVYRFEHLTHRQLVTLLAAAFAAFAAVPMLIEEGGSSRVAPIVLASAVALIAGLPLRRSRVDALALHVDPDGGERLESLRVELIARARVSVLPHAFALASAWVLSCVALEAGAATRALVAGLVYSAVLVVWARSLARSATDLDDWQRRMRRNEQAYRQDGAEGATLAEALVGARRRIFLAELAVALPLVALATVLTLSAPAQLLAQIPLGVAAVCATVIAVDLGLAFVRSLGAPFFSAALAAETAGEEPAAVGEKAQALVRYYARRLTIVVAILAVLSWIADTISLGELAVRAYEWLSGLAG